LGVRVGCDALGSVGVMRALSKRASWEAFNSPMMILKREWSERIFKPSWFSPFSLIWARSKGFILRRFRRRNLCIRRHCLAEHFIFVFRVDDDDFCANIRNARILIYEEALACAGGGKDCHVAVFQAVAVEDDEGIVWEFIP